MDLGAQWCSRSHQPRRCFNRWRPLDDGPKAAIRDSRMQATGALVRAITAMQQPSPIFISSSSAVGYYGSRGDEPATETTPADRISSRTSVATGKPPRISLLSIASRAAAQRRRAGATWRCPAPDGTAIQAVRRRTCGNRAAIHVVDSRARLGGDGEVGTCDPGRCRAAQRNSARSGDQ